MIEADAVFGRRWFLALALRRAPPPDDELPPAPPENETQPEETDECAS
ncbi:MAG: hypothetical protein IT518_29385 [Burkholderiales bacterium]|nr:hypothetical protein [Burkholderiales bacterium]